MPDTSDLRRERDEALVWAFTDRAQSLKDRYQEWITSETKDLRIQAGGIILPEGIIRRKMQASIRRLKAIDANCAKECQKVRERCQELRQGQWDNILEDHTYLQEALSQLHAMVEELHGIRRSFDDLENSFPATQT